MKKVIALILVIGFFVPRSGSEAEMFADEIANRLKTESYIYVATKRMNGEWSTAAPVWFMYDGEGLYFTTAPSSHKAHRIHRGSPVKIWVGANDGPSFEAKAQFVKDGALAERMGKAYSDKYWIAWLGFFRPRPARVGSGKTLVVKVTPTTQPATLTEVPVNTSTETTQK